MADWERQWPDPNESWAEAGKRGEEQEARRMQEYEGRFTHPARMVQSGPLAGAMVRVLEPGEPGYREALSRKAQTAQVTREGQEPFLLDVYPVVEPERPGLTDYERGYRAGQRASLQIAEQYQHTVATVRTLKIALAAPIPKEEPGD